MNIRVIYTGQLAAIAGVSAESLELPAGATLGDLARLVRSRHGADFAAFLCDESGGIQPTILVAIDGVQASGDRGSLPLAGVCEVMFLAPVAGG